MFKYNINGDCEHFDNTSMTPQGKKTVVSTIPQGSTNQDSTYSTLADMSSTLGNISSTLGNMSSTLGNMAKSRQPIQQTSNDMLGNTEKDNIIKRLLILNYKKNNNQSNIDETKIINEMWQKISQSEKNRIKQMTVDELNNILKPNNMLGNTEKDNMIKRLLILNYKKNNNQTNIDETKIVNDIWQEMSQSKKDNIKQMSMDELNNILKSFNVLEDTKKDNMIKRTLILDYRIKNNQMNVALDETKIIDDIWQKINQNKKNEIKQYTMEQLNDIIKSLEQKIPSQPISNVSNNVLGNTEKDRLIKNMLVLMYKMKNQIQVVPDETKAINDIWQSKNQTEKDTIYKMTINELNNTIKYFQEIVSRQQNISTESDNMPTKIPPSKLGNYKYSGCFSGRPERSSFVRIQGTHNIDSCINSVANSKEQYNYVSIQNGNQCWAGNNVNKNFFIPKDNYDPECNMNAPGAWINYMYQNMKPTTQNAPQTTQPLPTATLVKPAPQTTQPPPTATLVKNAPQTTQPQPTATLVKNAPQTTQPLPTATLVQTAPQTSEPPPTATFIQPQTIAVTADVEKDKLIKRSLILNFLKSANLLTPAMFDESIIINMVWGRMSQDEKNKLNNMSVDELKYYVNQISVEIQLQPTQTVGVDPNKEPDGTVDNMVALTFDDNSTIKINDNMTINNTSVKEYLSKRGNIKLIDVGKNMLVSVQLLPMIGKKIAISLNNIKTKFDSELSTVYQIIIRPLTDNDRKVELYRERDILFTVLKDGVKMNSNKGNSDNDEVESVKIGLAYAVFLKNEIMPQSILSGNHPEPEFGYYSRVFGMEIKPSKISFSEYN